MTQEKLTFTGESGDQLAGRLDIPDEGEPRGYVLFAHCFTGSKDVLAAVRIAKALWLRGFAVFRFDFTGLGESQGDFANTTFSSNVGDLVAAASFLRECREAPTVLIGHSLGGAAVLASAGKISEARAVCTIGAPADPEHVVHHFADARDEVEAAGEAEVTIGGRPFRVKSSFLEDIEAQSLDKSIRGMGKALLVFHSPVDDIVDIGNARRIYDAARHPKSFVCLDAADHMLTDRADAYYVAEVISAWANRYNEETAWTAGGMYYLNCTPTTAPQGFRLGAVVTVLAAQRLFLDDQWTIEAIMSALTRRADQMAGRRLGPLITRSGHYADRLFFWFEAINRSWAVARGSQFQ